LTPLSADSTFEANLPSGVCRSPLQNFAQEGYRMATTVREFSLDYYLLDRMKFSGVERENLTDLVSIIISLKNKYGIVPFAIVAHGEPIPNGVVVSYLIESTMMSKLLNVLLDTPRLSSVTVVPRGIPRSSHYEIKVTLGG
jgi:hypothetical protein